MNSINKLSKKLEKLEQKGKQVQSEKIHIIDIDGSVFAVIDIPRGIHERHKQT